jgi:hypothetical protein
MNRLHLKQCLDAAGIPEDHYLLVGLDPPRALREGACVLRPNQRDWEVLVWQPIRSRVSLTFLNEDQACDYLLDVLARPAPRRGSHVAEEDGERGAGADQGAPVTPVATGTLSSSAAPAGGSRRARLRL